MCVARRGVYPVDLEDDDEIDPVVVPTQALAYERDPRSGHGGSSSSASASAPSGSVGIAKARAGSPADSASAPLRLVAASAVNQHYTPPRTPPEAALSNVSGSIDILERSVRNRWR